MQPFSTQGGSDLCTTDHGIDPEEALRRARRGQNGDVDGMGDAERKAHRAFDALERNLDKVCTSILHISSSTLSLVLSYLC